MPWGAAAWIGVRALPSEVEIGTDAGAGAGDVAGAKEAGARVAEE